jgi:uncharacterized protein
MFARPLIDSIDFASNGKELQGETPIEALSRLGDTLSNSHGKLNYLVRGLHIDDRYFLEVVLSGVCHLRCQRCLGDLEYPVDLTSRVQLVSAEELGVVDEIDDGECIEASSQMDVLELVEDELLLGLPFAPRHLDGACSKVIDSLKQSSNPFSVLADLKKKH